MSRDDLAGQYLKDIMRLKEELYMKDEIITSLSNTITSKGNESAQLANTLSAIKNQMLDAGVFGQRFAIFKVVKNERQPRTMQFVKDTELPGEYFVQIMYADNSKVKKIPLLSIENLENFNGIIFNIVYYREDQITE